MHSDDEKTLGNLNQILLHLSKGDINLAIGLFDSNEHAFNQETDGHEIVGNFKKFIQQYLDGAKFLSAIANGNLDVNPPDDPLRQNYVIAQYKQLHSNLRHLTWQTQQIAKGDLKQKVSFLGEFSIAFNKMIQSLREKKQLEEKLAVQNEELQRLNATKDKFFSIIAHDLRGPLGGFMSLAQIMAEELPNITLTEVQEIAMDLKNSSANLFRLLENLLSWARVQQGQIPFEPEFWELHPLVNESVEMIKETAKNKGIEIYNHIPAGLMVFADKNVLQTVVRNLVSNSIKFTNRGGKITLSAKAGEGQNIQIAIMDTGIGMDKELIDKLFLLDAKKGRKGTNGEPSTGLGLLLCKEFIEKHGGAIWVESEEGKGSRFSFTIPDSNPKGSS